MAAERIKTGVATDSRSFTYDPTDENEEEAEGSFIFDLAGDSGSTRGTLAQVRVLPRGTQDTRPAPGIHPRWAPRKKTKKKHHKEKLASRVSNKISGIQADLSKVEKKLDDSSPQLNVPVSLQSLTTNIASFRGQIDELQCKAAGIIDEQAQLKTFIDSVKANVTLLYKNLQDIRKHSAETTTTSSQINKEDMVNFVIGKIRPDVNAVNTTLLSKVKWLSDDMVKAQKVISNLTDESALLKSYFLTIRNELTELRNGVKDHNNKWNELLGETKILRSNLTKVMTSCSQCKYWHNEESTKDIPSIASVSQTSNSTYN